MRHAAPPAALPSSEPGTGADVPPKAALPRAQRSVAPLLATARALIAAGRFDAMPLEQIAQQAGVSRRSLHNHFADREALCARVVDDARHALNDRIAGELGMLTDPAERMVHGLLIAYRHGLDSGMNEQLMLRVGAGTADPSSPGLSALTHELRHGMARGAFAPADIDAAVVLVLGTVAFGLGPLHRLQDRPQAARDWMQGLCLALLQGLRSRVRQPLKLVARALDARFPLPKAVPPRRPADGH